uniref:Uncharacterized protein n=1 Tax=Cucumis melo TaxID=3656 RepID=A0A9I9EH66_CUCME
SKNNEIPSTPSLSNKISVDIISKITNGRLKRMRNTKLNSISRQIEFTETFSSFCIDLNSSERIRRGVKNKEFDRKYINFGEVEIKLLVSPSGLLAKLVISGLHFMYVYDWSRFRCVVLHNQQIPLEKSNVSRLHAVFWAKLAGFLFKITTVSFR